MIRIKTDASNNTVTTVLNTSVQTSWNSHYQVGRGVNAITGQLRGTAIEPPTLKPSKASNPEYNYSLVASKEDLKEVISAEVGGSYNLDGVNLSASSSYLNEITVSELSLTLLTEIAVEQSEFATADSYKLINPVIGANFREDFGDYFVAGVRSGSSLFVMYQCRFKTSNQRDKFTAEVGASIPLVFDAKGRSEFEKVLNKFDGKVSISLTARGTKGPLPSPPGGTWTMDNIGEVVTWFNDHLEPTPVEALLYHYRLIDPKIPADVPIEPDVFTRLRYLYLQFWEAEALYKTCPPFGRPLVKDKMTILRLTLESEQGKLPEEPKKIEQRLLDAEEVLGLLNIINNRQIFYSQVVLARNSEPQAQQWIDADRGTVQWHYGFDQASLTGVVIDSITDDARASSGAGWRYHTFDYRNSGRVIVGWDVICNWTDGTGGDWKKLDGAPTLGSSEGHVQVKSDISRGFSWSVRWHTVDASLYPTGMWSYEGAYRDVEDDEPWSVDDDSALDYWTPERMAAAKPRYPSYDELDEQAPSRLGQAQAHPVAHPADDNHRQMGKLFFRTGNIDYVGSAVVVDRSVILTAGHNIKDKDGTSYNIVFIPAYDANAKIKEPFGRWHIDKYAMTSSWENHFDKNFDLAFCTVKPRDGTRIGDELGSKKVVLHMEASSWTSIGYPGLAPFNGQTMQQCEGKNVAINETGRIAMETVMTKGASGSPWFVGEDRSQVGGIVSSGTKTVDYSPKFAQWVQDLLNEANLLAEVKVLNAAA